eukprot:CAMPEP_0178933356 /NCGR_PEP_ID=MMETSP0786-20121207/23214_1 /TAXON_ID=186022 /ORGANISM="Thalassionema frauenfeldii, Strain CCMP 1798" /LENGTH=108 /DNA_ID=CAMNT_0020610923 /DNA_START=64 /DNA_END=390 /DNA_ORIENTATION=-
MQQDYAVQLEPGSQVPATIFSANATESLGDKTLEFTDYDGDLKQRETIVFETTEFSIDLLDGIPFENPYIFDLSVFGRPTISTNNNVCSSDFSLEIDVKRENEGGGCT